MVREMSEVFIKYMQCILNVIIDNAFIISSIVIYYIYDISAVYYRFIDLQIYGKDGKDGKEQKND